VIDISVMHIDDQLTSLLGNFQIASSQKQVIRSTSCLVLGRVLGGQLIECHWSGWTKLPSTTTTTSTGTTDYSCVVVSAVSDAWTGQTL